MTDIPNAFIGKPDKPTPKELADVLGTASPLWNHLLTDLMTDLGLTEQEWSSYSPKYGWHLRLKLKKRNIVYFSPCAGCFRVSFVLGDRAVAEARKTRLPASVLKQLDEAKRYPEGTGLCLTVTNAREIPSIEKLAQIKKAN